MALSARSTFRSATPDSLYWVGRFQNGEDRILSTNGYTFIRNLESLLRRHPRMGTPQPTYDGTRIQGSQVNETDGQWGPSVFKALWAVASLSGASQGILRDIAADARSGYISMRSVNFAAALVGATMGQQYVVRMPDLVLPQYNVRPPVRYLGQFPRVAAGPISAADADFAARSWTTSTDVTVGREGTAGANTGGGTSTGGATGRTATNTGDATSGKTAGTSGTPGTVTPGNQDDKNPVGGRSGTGAPVGSGVSWVAVAVVAGFVVAAGLMTVSLLNAVPPKRPALARAARRGR